MFKGLNSIEIGIDKSYSILYQVKKSKLFIYRGFVIKIGIDKSYSILYQVKGSRLFIYKGFIIGTSTDKSYTMVYQVKKYIAEILLYAVVGFCNRGNSP